MERPKQTPIRADIDELMPLLTAAAEYLTARGADAKLVALVHMGRAWTALPLDVRAALAAAGERGGGGA